MSVPRRYNLSPPSISRDELIANMLASVRTYTVPQIIKEMDNQTVTILIDHHDQQTSRAPPRILLPNCPQIFKLDRSRHFSLPRPQRPSRSHPNRRIALANKPFHLPARAPRHARRSCRHIPRDESSPILHGTPPERSNVGNGVPGTVCHACSLKSAHIAEKTFETGA